MVIKKQASSLYSLIADGKYRATCTSMGHKTWKMLIGPQASLQRNCIKKGFNAIGSNNNLAKQELVLLITRKMTVPAVISVSGLVQEGSLWTPTRVEMWPNTAQIMETKTSKPCVTSWCSESKTS